MTNSAIDTNRKRINSVQRKRIGLCKFIIYSVQSITALELAQTFSHCMAQKPNSIIILLQPAFGYRGHCSLFHQRWLCSIIVSCYPRDTNRSDRYANIRRGIKVLSNHDSGYMTKSSSPNQKDFVRALQVFFICFTATLAGRLVNEFTRNYDSSSQVLFV